MTRALTLCGLIVTLLAALHAGAAASTKLRFGGRWALDASKSKGVAPVIESQTMLIVTRQDTMAVEHQYVVNGKNPTITAGTVTVQDTFVIDGQAADFVWRRLNGQEGAGKRTSMRAAHGDTLEVHQKALFDSPQGPVTWHSDQKWWLSEDGHVLTVDAVVKVLPFTTIPLTSVFRRI